MIRSGRVLPVLALLFCALPAAAASPSYDALLGAWTGQGTVRPQLFDDRQAVRCRVKGTLDGPEKFTLTGRCATTVRSLQFVLSVLQTKGTTAITAVARIGDSATSYTYAGQRKGNGFVMHIREPFEQNGAVISSTFRIAVDGANRMTIAETVTEVETGRQSDALTLHLTRRTAETKEGVTSPGAVDPDSGSKQRQQER